MTEEDITGGSGGVESSDEQGLTRRGFVRTSGVAAGAVIIWASPFPFADAAIGQVIRNSGSNPTGATGPTGPSSGTGATAATGPAATGSTGTTGTSGASAPTYGNVSAGLGHLTDVHVKGGSLSFTQDIREPGTAHWSVFMSVPRKQAHITLRIGAAHHDFTSAGEHQIKVSFSAVGKRHAKRHPHADITIDTSFVDALGRRFAKSHKVKR